MPHADVEMTNKITKHTVHVERAIAKIKNLKLFLIELQFALLEKLIRYGMWLARYPTFSHTSSETSKKDGDE